MPEFVWETRSEDGWTLMSIGGAITEASDFAPLLERATDKVRVDLGGLRRINSSGVREWIRFVTALSEAREVVLERCAVPFVQQLNMIANMAGAARVASIMLPYYCADCDDERTILSTIGDDGVDIPEEPPCPDCHKPMEFDDIVETYAGFGHN